MVYTPSPNAFVADHVRRYEASGGVDGGFMRQEAPVVILHTIGRRTGAIRKTPLIRVRSGETYVAIASMGGAPRNPAWFLNLVANPSVRLQDRANVFDLSARPTRGHERARLWRAALHVWPDYDEYQAATDRDIPVVALEPH